jgi:hypothetical protein
MYMQCSNGTSDGSYPYVHTYLHIPYCTCARRLDRNVCIFTSSGISLACNARVRGRCALYSIVGHAECYKVHAQTLVSQLRYVSRAPESRASSTHQAVWPATAQTPRPTPAFLFSKEKYLVPQPPPAGSLGRRPPLLSHPFAR